MRKDAKAQRRIGKLRLPRTREAIASMGALQGTHRCRDAETNPPFSSGFESCDVVALTA